MDISNLSRMYSLDKEAKSMKGDLVSTSPASTLLPPNLPVGIIQSIEESSDYLTH